MKTFFLMIMKLQKFWIISSQTLWKHHEFPKNVHSGLFIGDIVDARLRAIVKYPIHPSILTIKKCKKRKAFFIFHMWHLGKFLKK